MVLIYLESIVYSVPPLSTINYFFSKSRFARLFKLCLCHLALNHNERVLLHKLFRAKQELELSWRLPSIRIIQALCSNVPGSISVGRIYFGFLRFYNIFVEGASFLGFVGCQGDSPNQKNPMRLGIFSPCLSKTRSYSVNVSVFFRPIIF